jgi:hypothetical protein
MKTLSSYADFTENHARISVPVTAFAGKTPVGFKKPRVPVNWVSESRFMVPLANVS